MGNLNSNQDSKTSAATPYVTWLHETLNSQLRNQLSDKISKQSSRLLTGKRAKSPSVVDNKSGSMQVDLQKIALRNSSFFVQNTQQKHDNLLNVLKTNQVNLESSQDSNTFAMEFSVNNSSERDFKHMVHLKLFNSL